MLGWFKKEKWKLDGKAFIFFETLFDRLPTQFSFLSQGLKSGLYKSFRVNPSMPGYHYTVSLAPGQYDKSRIKGLTYGIRNF